jgi:hypothetical protein
MEPLCRVDATAERYRCLRATQDIPARSVVLREAPSVHVRDSGRHHTLVWELTARCMADEATRTRLLTSFRRGAGLELPVWDASDERELLAVPPVDRATYKALYTVVQAVNLNARLGGCGVFETLDNINHSCDPNAVLIDTDDAGTKVLVARRSIRTGEEIAITYIQGLEVLPDARQRQAMLRETFGFVCACSRCRQAAS